MSVAHLLEPHLHTQLTLAPGHALDVTIDRPANVWLMDATNYNFYMSGAQGLYLYVGGAREAGTHRLVPPVAGQWHLVVDLKGRTGRVNATFRVVAEN